MSFEWTTNETEMQITEWFKLIVVNQLHTWHLNNLVSWFRFYGQNAHELDDHKNMSIEMLSVQMRAVRLDE